VSNEGFMRLHGPVELASGEVRCWKCQKTTPVFALLTTDLEEVEPDQEVDRLEAPAFLYDLSPGALPPAVKAELAKLAPNYRPTYSRSIGDTCWANVCSHCGVLQGAFFLHSEPDGPFFGGPEEYSGPKITLSARGFAVEGASYSV